MFKLLVASVVLLFTLVNAQYAREEDYGPADPYSYGYESNDEYGTKLTRKEESDGSGAVRGSYGYTDASGIYRTVEYVADANGFRATVSSNEPGMGVASPADATFQVQEAPASAYATTNRLSAAASYQRPFIYRRA